MLGRLLAIMFACALAMPVVLAAAADSVPFHAVLNTTPAVVGPCRPTCLALEITGSAQATHLGRTGRFAGSSGTGSYSGSAAGPAGTLLLDGSIAGPGKGN